jgi:hypothetical protein
MRVVAAKLFENCDDLGRLQRCRTVPGMR